MQKRKEAIYVQPMCAPFEWRRRQKRKPCTMNEDLGDASSVIKTKKPPNK